MESIKKSKSRKIEKMKLTAAHWGTYKVKSDKRKNFKLFPFEQDKDPSDIGWGIETAIEGSSRIEKPAIRKGWLEDEKKQKIKRSLMDEVRNSKIYKDVIKNFPDAELTDINLKGEDEPND